MLNFKEKQLELPLNVIIPPNSSLSQNRLMSLECKISNKQERQIVAKYARLTPSYNHPRNFIAIASIVLEICTWQNSSMEINKGQ